MEFENAAAQNALGGCKCARFGDFLSLYLPDV